MGIDLTAPDETARNSWQFFVSREGWRSVFVAVLVGCCRVEIVIAAAFHIVVVVVNVVAEAQASRPPLACSTTSILKVAHAQNCPKWCSKAGRLRHCLLVGHGDGRGGGEKRAEGDDEYVRVMFVTGSLASSSLLLLLLLSLSLSSLSPSSLFPVARSNLLSSSSFSFASPGPPSKRGVHPPCGRDRRGARWQEQQQLRQRRPYRGHRCQAGTFAG